MPDATESVTLVLLIPSYDPDHPQPYPGEIQPGNYDLAALVELLRRHQDNLEAIQFIADMLED